MSTLNTGAESHCGWLNRKNVMQITFLAKLPHIGMNNYFQPGVCWSQFMPTPERQLLNTQEFHQ